MNPVGLYIHFPFCISKCPYCDFYSQTAGDGVKAAYAEAVVNTLRGIRKERDVSFDTVYFGGGTPSVAGAENIRKIAECVTSENGGQTISEFTVECNPSFIEDGFFRVLYDCGVNRISMGLQSAVDSERAALGRRGTVADVSKAVFAAKTAGITNISLDLMLGIPGQTLKSLEKSVAFCLDSGASHVSAYLLKIEEGTPFYERREKLRLPDEEECSELYLRACELLSGCGFSQYEISNFAKPGFESRHNLKYWKCQEYAGIGPSAHSFLSGKRFYYRRDLNAFLNGDLPKPDGNGGDFEEYAMLRLRLSDGLVEKEVIKRFGFPIPEKMKEAAKRLCGMGVVIYDLKGIRITRKGFLLSNSVISELLMNL